MTVNGDKCGFALTVLKFFAHKLSSDGVSPSEEKVIAIIDARLPVTCFGRNNFFLLLAVFECVFGSC